MTDKPKLIEVALPLLEINKEAARGKVNPPRTPVDPAPVVGPTAARRGPRRDLGIARRRPVMRRNADARGAGDRTGALVRHPPPTRRVGELERPALLAEAKAEIDRCFDGDPPPILDPFGGGGAIPLEAQRLGLTALSGDLNPVAVLIQKAMLEIPPRFAGRPPVNPTITTDLTSWTRAQGLAADVEAYGKWMRDEAWKRIGHLYPDATGPGGEKLTPIAWIWARTVESPDPTWHGHVPLVASWVLAKGPKKQTTWVEPIIHRADQTISYEIRVGGEPSQDRTVDRGGGTCLATGSAMPYSFLRPEFQRDSVGQSLMAIVAEGPRGRAYCAPTVEQEVAADSGAPSWAPSGSIFDWPGRTNVVRYGMERWEQLFTPRQLTALTTFSDLLGRVRERVILDAEAAGLHSGARLREGGDGAEAYADSVVTYLAFVVDKCADYWSTVATWDSTKGETVRNTFARQAIPMTWNWVEASPFSSSTGSFDRILGAVGRAIEHLPASGNAEVRQRDARARVEESHGSAISTDPPYYDNISYADLSDYFYVWLRRNLGEIWPDECSTLLTPKAEEMIANQYRAGSKRAAEQHFETGMAEFMSTVAEAQHPDVPATIYYAYKATETKDGAVRSTGWDTFLQSVVDAGFRVTATWPMRTELGNRLIASGTNALASSIVLACRPRTGSAAMASRGEFVAALRAELPEAVRTLQSGNIAPVDIPQSTIGPGIGVFSRYSKVVESDGSAMNVSAALSIINDVLGEVLDGEESEMDRDSRFALAWYAQHGYQPASSGEAISLAQAKNTSLDGVVNSGIGDTRGGKFRLFRRDELADGWSPLDDHRRTVWESTQYLIAALERSETDAADLLQRLGGYGESARQLAYLLFKKATDKRWADEAASYNGLIEAWPTLRATEVASTANRPTL